MSIHDETKFPNAFVRFRRQAGLVPTILWCVCSVAFAVLMTLDVASKGLTSPMLGCLAGALLAVLARPLLLLKPMFTMHAFRVLWFAMLLYGFIGHRVLGRPDWSWWLIFTLVGFYLAASFVFWSSKFLYIGKLIAEMPERSERDDDDHEEDEQDDAIVDQQVEEARRRGAKA
jgi:hypothetical protein